MAMDQNIQIATEPAFATEDNSSAHISAYVSYLLSCAHTFIHYPVARAHAHTHTHTRAHMHTQVQTGTQLDR